MVIFTVKGLRGIRIRLDFSTSEILFFSYILKIVVLGVVVLFYLSNVNLSRVGLQVSIKSLCIWSSSVFRYLHLYSPLPSTPLPVS